MIGNGRERESSHVHTSLLSIHTHTFDPVIFHHGIWISIAMSATGTVVMTKEDSKEEDGSGASEVSMDPGSLRMPGEDEGVEASNDGEDSGPMVVMVEEDPEVQGTPGGSLRESGSDEEDEEEEEEEDDYEMMNGEADKNKDGGAGKKKARRSVKPYDPARRRRGDASRSLPIRDSHLAKQRMRREKKLLASGGSGSRKKKVKLSASTRAKQDAYWYGKNNGLLIPTANIERFAHSQIDRIAPMLEEERRRVAKRLEAQGLPVPKNLSRDLREVDWRLSGNARQLLRGAIQADIDKKTSVASRLRKHRGRVTVEMSDIVLADELLNLV